MAEGKTIPESRIWEALDQIDRTLAELKSIFYEKQPRSCLGSCQSACEMYCKAACQTNCMTACQIMCQSMCQSQNQIASGGLKEQESSYGTQPRSCLGSCQSACEMYCKAACQTNCMTACQIMCQSMCQSQNQIAGGGFKEQESFYETQARVTSPIIEQRWCAIEKSLYTTIIDGQAMKLVDGAIAAGNVVIEGCRIIFVSGSYLTITTADDTSIDGKSVTVALICAIEPQIAVVEVSEDDKSKKIISGHLLFTTGYFNRDIGIRIDKGSDVDILLDRKVYSGKMAEELVIGMNKLDTRSQRVGIHRLSR
jgi:hypothetical protein